MHQRKTSLFILGLVGMLGFMACQSPPVVDAKELAGRWKVYDVRYAGKDISKSSDPGFKNGMNFDAAGGYTQFGHPSYQDTGTYRLEADRIYLYARQDTLWGRIDLVDDTLALYFPIQEEQLLKMKLYRMEGSN